MLFVFTYFFLIHNYSENTSSKKECILQLKNIFKKKKKLVDKDIIKFSTPKFQADYNIDTNTII